MYLHAHVIISILFSYHRDSSSCIILNSIAHVVTKFVNISTRRDDTDTNTGALCCDNSRNDAECRLHKRAL